MSITPKLFRDFSLLSDPTPMTITADWKPLRDLTTLLANGGFARNVVVGEALRGREMDASTAGTFDLPFWIPDLLDNQGSRLTSFNTGNGGTLKVQYRVLLQVSNAAITVTPVIYDLTTGANATYSGATACSGTADAFTDANQRQTLVLTVPVAAHEFKPRVTIGGSVATGEFVRALFVRDCYVDI